MQKCVKIYKDGGAKIFQKSQVNRPNQGHQPWQSNSLEVSLFHPIHNWESRELLCRKEVPVNAKFGYEHMSADEVLRESVAFNVPWQSSRDTDHGQRVNKLDFEEGSFYHKVLSHLSSKLGFDVLQQCLTPAAYTDALKYTRARLLKN